MINKLISGIVKGLQKSSLLYALLFILFTGLPANSQTYEFGTSSLNKESASILNRDLTINQTTGTVKLVFSISSISGSFDDVVFDTRIGIILVNEKSEIVIGDSDDEFIAAVYVNNSGTEGYFVYNDVAENNMYKVSMSKPENNLATFKKLKQAVESGAFNKSTPKNSAASASSVTASSSGRLPLKGAKTADILASHPIGFLPPNCLSKSEITKAMKEEGWPVNDHNAYRADINYKVPFTIYGANVWAADMSFDKGILVMYSFDTYEMTGKVTEKRILDYVGQFLTDLKKAGYQIIKHNTDRETGDAHYYWTLSNGSNTVAITANSGGKVFFKVYLNSAKK